MFIFADIAHMIKMYYVGSFNFEQRKGFYTKIAKIMNWVEIGWIGCLAGKSKGAPRIFFLFYMMIFIIFLKYETITFLAHFSFSWGDQHSNKVFSTISVATLSVKACLRAAAMFTISNEDTRQTKSSRAGLLLHVGKMHRWMTLVKVGKFVHEMAAIYLR